MKNKLFLLLLLLFNCVFSQEENIKIEFNIKGNLEYYNYKYKDFPIKLKKHKIKLIPTLRADITEKHGDFSLLLMDYNNNGTFLDYRKLGSKIGSDGIYIVDYQKSIKKIDRSSRKYITRNYPILFNGISYRLKNLKKIEKDRYSAELTQEYIESVEIIKNKNGSLIDRLPNIKLSNYKKKELVALNKFLKKGNLLYLNFYNDDEKNSIQFFIEPPVLNNLSKSFPQLKILNIGIINNEKTFDFYLNKYRINKDEILTVNRSQYDKILKLGYNFIPLNGSLFNDKGKVIMSNINASILKKYLYEKRKENLEKKKINP